jgi:hypothetical protein
VSDNIVIAAIISVAYGGVLNNLFFLKYNGQATKSQKEERRPVF